MSRDGGHAFLGLISGYRERNGRSRAFKELFVGMRSLQRMSSSGFPLLRSCDSARHQRDAGYLGEAEGGGLYFHFLAVNRS